MIDANSVNALYCAALAAKGAGKKRFEMSIDAAVIALESLQTLLLERNKSK